MKTFEYIIVGAGIIGLAVARALKDKLPNARIAILEKEAGLAYHSSGRNSGVLHAGFYYTEESLKAKFTAKGNRALKDYCLDKNLKLNECGKVVVAKNEIELNGLEELFKRGQRNGVELNWLSEKELIEIEPHAKTYRKALYSPTTASVDPVEICLSLMQDLRDRGVEFYFGEKFRSKGSAKIIHTSSGNEYCYDLLINCAGLYADKIAREYGFSKKYTIIPFKGVYLKYSGGNLSIQTNIYPVPNLNNPFLGVHYTLTVDNQVKIGPTAIPAFWRENYHGFKHFSFFESFNVTTWLLKLFLHNSFNFRTLAFDEMNKYWKPAFRRLAEELVHKIDSRGFDTWSKPGIRAQLLNTETFELVQDFVVEGDTDSVHVLNAVSPAFTSSLPFGEWVVDNHVVNK